MTVPPGSMIERPRRVDGRYGAAMDGPIPVPRADPLGAALHLLRMDGAFYCRSELRAPWGLELPALPGYLWFHVVTAGVLRLEAGDTVRTIGTGEVALVPRGEGHILRSEAGAPAPSILAVHREQVSDRYEVLRHGGDGAPTTLLCGAVRFGHPAAASFVGVLPEVLHLEGVDRLQPTLSLMAAEAREQRLGGEAIITRLADILVIQALRAWLETDPGAQTGWLGALRDEQIGTAIALIHADPARDWTVESLARELAMSRSAFAARFTALVGEPAIAYVTRWRMQVAVAALRDEGATVGELATRLGYRSEAAFARAFKRETGMPPGAVRRLPDALEAFAA
jgi:AraC-like DNA-binding protein